MWVTQKTQSLDQIWGVIYQPLSYLPTALVFGQTLQKDFHPENIPGAALIGLVAVLDT